MRLRARKAPTMTQKLDHRSPFFIAHHFSSLTIFHRSPFFIAHHFEAQRNRTLAALLNMRSLIEFNKLLDHDRSGGVNGVRVAGEIANVAANRLDDRVHLGLPSAFA